MRNHPVCLGRTVLAVAIVMACSGAASAQMPSPPVPEVSRAPTLLSGIVVSADGAAVAGATVTLTETATGQKRAAVTDVRGAFRFSDVVGGALELKAELSGFAAVTRQLSASAGATTTTALVMGAAGGPVPVPSPKPAAPFPAKALESIVGEAALADLLRTESVGRRVLLAVVSLGERRSLFVFEQRDTSATVYELVPMVLPAEGDGLQELLETRPSMTFAGLHVLTAKSGVLVFRHGR